MGGWRSFIPALALSLVGIGALGVAKAWPDAAQPVAVYSLEGDALAAVIAAGGRIVSPGGLDGSIIAVGDTPDFPARLYAAGASLVIRADSTIGCLSARSPS
jgi:hypothetical protein